MSDSARTFCFVLLPHVHLLDMAGPAQVFFEAASLGGARYRVTFAALDAQVTTMQGLPLGPLPSFDQVVLKKDDFILIPGVDFRLFSEGAFASATATLGPWLREQLRKGVHIASICTGALILADAGLLRRRKCTTHWKCIDYMKQHYPDVQVQSDCIFVNDEGIYTSAGMASGIDMALAIVEEHYGPVLPSRVAREMVVHLRRGGSASQDALYLDYRTHFNPAIHRIQDYLVSHPDEDPSLDALADKANMSVRTLTRTFKQATGHTLVSFKNHVKMELARSLLHNPELTVERVATMSGFGSARHFRRVWKKEGSREESPAKTRRL